MKISSTAYTPAPKADTENYSTILRLLNQKFSETDDGYLHVREVRDWRGWVLNISAVKTEISSLLKAVIPFLIKEKVSFKLVKDKVTATLLLDGRLGYNNVGKILTIYPGNDQSSKHIASTLIQITQRFKGPAVPTDCHLGGTVYTSYVDKANERYTIPFQYPKGIVWPFEVPKPQVPKTEFFIGDNCLITSTIKSDAKGTVSKGLRLHSYWVQSCLIKEGKHNMFSDDNGRSIQERLSWQYKLQKELNDLPLPKVYDLVNQDNNTYLVMQFVKGESLHNVVTKVNENNCWANLSLQKKIILLDYLLQVIEVIDKLHHRGYVHRDITPANFLFDRNNNIVMIDLELAYSIKDRAPDPPFNFGTNGFMSPEQQATQEPSVKEDMYSLGALMIVLFTNLYPGKFGTIHLKEKLQFFIQDDSISDLIGSCMERDPWARPDLQLIRKTLTDKKMYLTNHNSIDIKALPNDNVDNLKVEDAIRECISAFSSQMMVETGKIWHSAPEEEKLVANKQRSQCFYPGLNGLAGVMYVLANANEANIYINKTIPICTRSIKYIRNVFNSSESNTTHGLYQGTHGVAVFYDAGIRNGMIVASQDNKKFMLDCLQVTNTGLDLASGLAGQGLAALSCWGTLKDSVPTIAKQCASIILSQQLSDGSWKCEGEKRTGLSYGVAGITIFLLKYYKYFPDEDVMHSVYKALDWLSKRAQKNNDSKALTWHVSDKQKRIDPWLSEGITGIALCFIRASEMTGVTEYKEIAQAALSDHPLNLVCGNLGFMEGIAGIGEVYLEAAFAWREEDKWQRRADWITNFLINARVHQQDRSSYWITDENKIPTADLFTGNSGVLHYLLRSSNPVEFEFPIL